MPPLGYSRPARVQEHQVTIHRDDARPTAVIAASTSWEEFPTVWPALFSEVWAVVRDAPDCRPGRNVILYRDDVPNVEVGVEMEGRFHGRGRVLPSALPAGPAASTVSRGAPSREGLGAAHAAVVSFCEAAGHRLAGLRWEVYDHWRDDQDPDAFQTHIGWLLADDRAYDRAS
jgi:hypothetical protein